MLERYRSYLGLLARLHVGRHLQGKIDLSGVVQQTLLEAHRGLPQVQTRGPDELAAWLRRILVNNLADELRKLRTGKRDVHRERPLDALLAESSARLEAWLAADQLSPSQQAERAEEAVRVAEALAALPEAQRQALELQHWHGCSLGEIAEQMGRSRVAVAGLIKRGLEGLRRTIDHDP